jgi:acetyl-CoA synthetase
MWEPPKGSIEKTNVKHFMDRLGVQSYGELVRRSTEDISWWWETCERELHVEWSKPYSRILDASLGIEKTVWFPGGELNAIETVLDQKSARNGNSKAFIWEGENGSNRTVTYAELQRDVSMFSNYLKGIGIKRGDVVASCLPMLPETVVAMLGTIRVGAVFSPIFSAYPSYAISNRISNSNPKLIVTCDGYLHKGKIVSLWPEVDEALRIAKLEIPTLIVERLGIELPFTGDRDAFYKEKVRKESTRSKAEIMKPDDPALLLYTSGAAGKPKGVVISHSGVLLQPGKEMYFNLDTRPNDVFMWMTMDISWMMGPWQVFGVQAVGATHVFFEGVPDFPDQDRIYRMIEEYGITQFGHVATTARMLHRHGNEIIKEHNLSSLRILGNTGEPIDEDTWTWEMKSIGGWNCPMINLSGGTEIFGCFLLPSPVVPLKPSTLWGPGLGMDVDVYDDEGASVKEKVGYLVCKKPSPSMTRGFWNDFGRYIETYWSRFRGVWYHGDRAYVDSDGYWFLKGRADDVIKVAGHRVDPAEIEGVLNSHPAIAESACVALLDKVKGEKPCCFAILNSGVNPDKETAESAMKLVVQKLGKIPKPDKVVFVDDLPRTRSGKIIRYLIRAVVRGDNPTEIWTIANPESLHKIKEAWERQKQV